MSGDIFRIRHTFAGRQKASQGNHTPDIQGAESQGSNLVLLVHWRKTGWFID